MKLRNFAYGASAMALLLSVGTAVHAQETTGGIRGQITDETGAPVAGATVTVRHSPTGTTSTTVTSGDGVYSLRNLRVGGPYEITVLGSGYQQEVANLASIGVGDPASANIVVYSEGASQLEDIIVTGSAINRGLQTGPRTRYSADDISQLPSISRDIKDFVRTSPFAQVDPTNNDALIIGGQSNRVNALVIDGVRQGDDFGLNSNGYPTQRSPISLSTIEAVNLEVAPFDVQYTQFQGGLVNVVTKGGGNEFSGEAFYEYTGDSLQGDHFAFVDGMSGVDRTGTLTGEFEQTTWGATLSGPIIADRLFFLLNYEYFEETTPEVVISGSNTNVTGISQADVDQVREIMNRVYGFDPLDWRASPVVEDEKWFARLDWNINDNHRAVLSWQHTQGAVLNTTGDSNSTSTPTLGLASKDYTLDTQLDVYKLQIFSDWTDNFSTELSFGRKEVVNISSPLGGSDFAQFQVYLPGATTNANGQTVAASCTNATPCRSILLGPDVSRHANGLTNDVDQFRFVGRYNTGDHNISFGFEREEVEIFNVFVQNANGAYVFRSLTDLENRNAASLTYANAASNIKSDGAAQFGYAVNSLYVQDEFDVNADLTLRFGLRYDQYEQSDRPLYNAAFEANYGFRNDGNLEGLDLIQPRFGFTWKPDELTTIYGGAGLFLGGSPNVWISNNFTNTGNLLGSVACNVGNQATVCPGSLTNVDGFNVGVGAETANTNSANAGTGTTNAIHPTFQVPSIWKFSIGMEREVNFTDWNFTRFAGDGWRFRAELLWSDVRRGVNWVDLYQGSFQNGTAPDGRPVYGARSAVRQDLVLINTDEGGGFQWALGVNKAWNEGWLDGLDIDLSYTAVDSTDVNPGTSSVAASNYGQVAAYDPNNLSAATSNYQIEYATKLSVGYERAFFGDYRTSVRLFAQRRAGLPYSFTYDEPANSNAAFNGIHGEAGIYTQRDRQLLYVPATSGGVVTLTSDPLVTYAAGFDMAAFNTFLTRTGLIQYAGQVAPRNGFRSPDVTVADIRLSQELPAFFPGGARLTAYMDIENFGNLLNDEWGVVQQQGFPYFYPAVVAQRAPGQPATGSFNQYQYNSFNGTRTNAVFGTSSVWQIKFGVRYSF